jgi:hypothetical protein
MGGFYMLIDSIIITDFIDADLNSRTGCSIVKSRL